MTVFPASSSAPGRGCAGRARCAGLHRHAARLGHDRPADRGREPRGQAAWIVDFLLLTAQTVPTVAEELGIGTAAALRDDGGWWCDPAWLGMWL